MRTGRPGGRVWLCVVNPALFFPRARVLRCFVVPSPRCRPLQKVPPIGGAGVLVSGQSGQELQAVPVAFLALYD